MLYNETGEYFILISIIFLARISQDFILHLQATKKHKTMYHFYQAVLFTHTVTIDKCIYRTGNRLESIL